jgi:hypothetical protein
MYQEAVKFIQQVGFPIFVACWFMFRLEKRINRMMELQAAHLKATAVLAKSLDIHREQEPRRELADSSEPKEEP